MKQKHQTYQKQFFVYNIKHTSLLLFDQANISGDVSVEKKCVLTLLNSNHLNPWIRIIEHLLQLIKLVITGENGFHMLYLSRSYSTQHKEETQWKKTIMNTTRGDQTDEAVCLATQETHQ